MGMSCENEEKYWRKWEKNGLERDDMMKNFFFHSLLTVRCIVEVI